MRILLVEDNQQLADGIITGLTKIGMHIDHVPTFHQAQMALLNEAVSAIILDLGLPDGDGKKLLFSWRQQEMSTPIIVLTANTDFDTKLECLNLGADDYLGKPFDIRELAARLKAIVRRSHGNDNNQIDLGNLVINQDACEVEYNKNTIQLSRREYQLLLELAQSSGRVLSRNQLEQLTYGWDSVGSNSIEVHIHNLRKKMSPELIKTIRGIGYTLIENA